MKQDSPKEESSEPSDIDSSEGVVIPEEFQKQVHGLVHKASKAHIKHIQDRCNARQDEIHQAEMKKNKGKNPKEFSTEGMPY